MSDFQEYYLTEELNHPKLDNRFVTILINYLEKRFPSYGDLTSGIGEELGKSGMSADDMLIVRKKISGIVNKEKVRFLEKVRAKVEKLGRQSEPVVPPNPTTPTVG